MNKLTTHKGNTLLLIEVPLDAYGFKISVWSDKSTTLEFYSETFEMEYDSHEFNVDEKNQLKEITLSFDENFKCELIGTTSTLTDKDVEPFVEKAIEEITFGGEVYYNYETKQYSLCDIQKSWNSFLQANRIDTNKNWCVLKLKND